jgi:hypothetical protein
MLQINKELVLTTPDWKKRDNKILYKSKSILSELWHSMNDAINGTKISSTSSSTTQCGSNSATISDRFLPKPIRQKLDSCLDKETIEQIRIDVRNKISWYLTDRAIMYKTLNHEEYLEWKKRFADERRPEILNGNEWNGTSNTAIAAVLYEQCREEDFRLDEQVQRKNKENSYKTEGLHSDAATEFAWAVANDELRILFASKNFGVICIKEEEINIYRH